jgi:hypothetical protein
MTNSTRRGLGLIVDDVGTVVLDATVAGGAYDAGTKTGWKVDGASTSFTYKNPGNHPDGIILVGAKLLTSSPGALKVKAKGAKPSCVSASNGATVKCK